MSKIRIYGDTSGYVDLAAPAVADNSVMSMDNIATKDYADSVAFAAQGNAISAAANDVSGKIVKIEEAVQSGSISGNGTQTFYPVTLNYTPLYNNSKLFINFSGSISGTGYYNVAGAYAQLLINNSNVSSFSVGLSEPCCQDIYMDTSMGAYSSGFYLYNVSSTSSIEIKMKTNVNYGISSASHSASSCKILVMEIGQ